MIRIKTEQEIMAMRPAGALSKIALRKAGEQVVPGTTTYAIDKLVEGIIRAHGGTPAFLNYNGFPASTCISINNEVVHGIPSQQRTLNDGDVVSIDTGAIVDGWVGDNAWTFYCGTPSAEARELCEVTRDCLAAAINEALPNNHLGDIGNAVQSLAERHGFGVLRDYVGHGVGKTMHEEPQVPNYGQKGRGIKLQVGMVIAIEPMIVKGSNKVKVMPNKWTVVTRDGSLAAHYENTVAITSDGPYILTEDALGPWCALQGGMDQTINAKGA